MATNQNLKDATSFPARPDNLLIANGRTVGNTALTRLADALKASYPYPGAADGAWPAGRPDANDAAAWLWHEAAGLVKQCERKVAEAAVAQPAEYEG